MPPSIVYSIERYRFSSLCQPFSPNFVETPLKCCQDSIEMFPFWELFISTPPIVIKHAKGLCQKILKNEFLANIFCFTSQLSHIQFLDIRFFAFQTSSKASEPVDPHNRYPISKGTHEHPGSDSWLHWSAISRR